MASVDKNVLTAAIDFSEDYSQICYFDNLMKEPESMGVMHSDKHFLIPSVLWFDDSGKRCCYGQEAEKCSGTRKGTTVKNFIKMFEDDEKVNVCGKEYEAKEIIEKYFDMIFKAIRGNKEKAVPAYVAVTVDKMNASLAALLYNVLEKCGYGKDKVTVISHSESFLYYAMSREKELLMNDVAMFDFNNEHFYYKKFSILRNRKPQLIDTVERNYSEDITYNMLKEDAGKEKADVMFFDFLQAEFKNNIVSTVYLTGTGFYEEWMKKSLDYVCARRRVFKGYNLYVKGACYAAMEKAGQIEYKNMIFKCSGRTLLDVKLVIDHKGRQDYINLSEAGMNWYEAGARADCITNGDENIEFIIESPVSGVKKKCIIDISGFPERPPKTTRIGITTGYIDEERLCISIEDKGFGDFYQSSGLVKRQVIDVCDYL